MPIIQGDYLQVPNFRQIFDLAVAGHVRNLPPSIADITHALHRNASSVHKQVRLLQEAGFISLIGEANRTRAVVLTDQGIERADLKPRAPIETESLVLPDNFEFKATAHPATCGAPMFADGDLQRAMIARLFPKWRDGDRIILPIGDSMECPGDPESSICEGDWVHARDNLQPASGERVYVEYSTGFGVNECTIKYFFLDEWTGVVTLKPANPAYPEIIRDARDVQVFSVVLDWRRLMGNAK